MTSEEILNSFNQIFGSQGPVTLVQAPGRVNLIGEHTDYNDGFVLPMTIDKAVYAALRKRNDNQINIHSLNYNQTVNFKLDRVVRSQNKPWINYLKGVILELKEAELINSGFDCAVWGNIPIASGLSSSAALETATAYGLQQLFNFDLPAIDMIKLCQKAENQFVGVQCGIMDQFVSRLGSTNFALFIDCRTLHYKSVPFSLNGHVLVIIDSKVKRQLVDSAYNKRRLECESGVEYFSQFGKDIKALRDVSMQSFKKHSNSLDPVVRKRVEHVITENKRVLLSTEYLSNCNYKNFGKLMIESHISLKDNYEVSCEQLDFLVEKALECKGVLGSRMTGAGFGGCTVSLVKNECVKDMIEFVEKEYSAKFGIEAASYVLHSNLETKNFNKFI